MYTVGFLAVMQWNAVLPNVGYYNAAVSACEAASNCRIPWVPWQRCSGILFCQVSVTTMPPSVLVRRPAIAVFRGSLGAGSDAVAYCSAKCLRCHHDVSVLTRRFRVPRGKANSSDSSAVIPAIIAPRPADDAMKIEQFKWCHLSSKAARLHVQT